MGEKIFDFLKNFATGKHSKKLGGLVLLIIFVLLIFPYIDANFLYYNRIKKRIDNLSALVNLSGKAIEEIPELLSEYNSIIEKINDPQAKSLISAMNNSSNTNFEYWIKFISGSFLFALVGIIGFCQKKKDVNIHFPFYEKQLLNYGSMYCFCGNFCIRFFKDSNDWFSMDKCSGCTSTSICYYVFIVSSA